jgi:hypothetical protein
VVQDKRRMINQNLSHASLYLIQEMLKTLSKIQSSAILFILKMRIQKTWIVSNQVILSTKKINLRIILDIAQIIIIVERKKEELIELLILKIESIFFQLKKTIPTNKIPEEKLTNQLRIMTRALKVLLK